MNEFLVENQNIERALLGLVIRKPNLVSQIIGVLREEYFDGKNKEVFLKLENLFKKNQKIDEKILIDNLVKNDKSDLKIWAEYIADLKLDSGFELNIRNYIDLILEKYQKQQLSKVLDSSLRTITKGNKSKHLDEIIQDIESNIFHITKSRELKDFEPIVNLTEEFSKKLELIKKEGYKEGIESEIGQLDFILGGFKKGEFIIIAARPSMGKTAFALQIVNNISRRKKIGLFSLEMPTTSILQRLISSEAMITQDFVRNYDRLNDKEIKRVQLAIERIKPKNIWIDDTPGLTLGELTWKIRKLHSLVNLDLIVIDYLQLLESNNRSDNRQQEITEISRTLKSLAREIEIPIIALSQLSRRVETREDKRPMMSDLRESGAIEQDADVVLLLYRANYYNKGEQQRAIIEDLEVIVSKNRNGKTGISKLDMNMEFGKITSKVMTE
ncbi:MAG: replicative DNA helicase [Candidatus Hepatoplasma vulgare]|nr:MAG: replicative DNA helicase [Candidatus Hepatoplasma sp.]